VIASVEGGGAGPTSGSGRAFAAASSAAAGECAVSVAASVPVASTAPVAAAGAWSYEGSGRVAVEASGVVRWSRRRLRAILRCAGQQYRRASPEATSLIIFEQPGSAHTACASPPLAPAALMRGSGHSGLVEK
jgi:hypothetical protein